MYVHRGGGLDREEKKLDRQMVVVMVVVINEPERVNIFHDKGY